MTENLNIFPDGRMTPADAARYTGFKAGTLANWRTRTNGGGPPFIKKRGKVWYLKDELDRWLRSGETVFLSDQTRLSDKLTKIQEKKGRFDDQTI